VCMTSSFTLVFIYRTWENIAHALHVYTIIVHCEPKCRLHKIVVWFPITNYYRATYTLAPKLDQSKIN
jgi:hypothetical protein